MNALRFYKMETDEISERGELYFVKFIINLEKDNFEPGVILGRSFMRLAKRVVDFGNGVIHKMITYGLCQRTVGYGKIQKNDLWLLSMFDARHQNRVLTEDVVRSLSALIYYRDLDTTTFRDLVDSDGKLIPEDSQPCVPRVGIPRPPRASMQDLYDWMGAYNPPSYAHLQYDQYYQQYQPLPPQYQQQQDDDEKKKKRRETNWRKEKIQNIDHN
nr:hypothetical protein [Tanacetum cinerariifolium]